MLGTTPSRNVGKRTTPVLPNKQKGKKGKEQLPKSCNQKNRQEKGKLLTTKPKRKKSVF